MCSCVRLCTFGELNDAIINLVSYQQLPYYAPSAPHRQPRLRYHSSLAIILGAGGIVFIIYYDSLDIDTNDPAVRCTILPCWRFYFRLLRPSFCLSLLTFLFLSLLLSVFTSPFLFSLFISTLSFVLLVFIFYFSIPCSLCLYLCFDISFYYFLRHYSLLEPLHETSSSVTVHERHLTY